MKNKKVLTIVLGVLAAVVIIGGAVLAQQWNKPMAATLSQPTRTPTEEPVGPVPTETGASEAIATQETPTQAATSTPKPSPTKGPVCGDEPLKYYLVMGIGDTDTEYLYGVADLVRIVRVDFVTPKVSVLTLPRDMLVELPNTISSAGEVLTQGKLNQAYFFGSPGMAYYKGPGEGPGSMAETIALNFDLYVDHYGAVNMDIFKDIIDAMGGVDIYLEEFVDGRPIGEESFALDKSQGYFDQGWNHMTGKDALSFVRIRDRYGETKRTENQTLLICAIKDKLTRPEIIGSVPKLVRAVIDNTRTDLSLAQISDLLCVLPRLTGENLQFFHMPFKTADNPDGLLEAAKENVAMLQGESFVYKYDRDAVKAFIDKFENDQLVPEPATGTGGCPAPPSKTP